jgi:uncharacterized protein (TIGR03083 family)
MTVEAVHALRADSEALLAAAASFTEDDWATASGCAGWSVRDVFIHLDNLFRLVTDPSSLPQVDPAAGTEQTQHRLVEDRRGQSSAATLDAYRTSAAAALTVLEALQAVNDPIDLGDLGKHPTHMVANAYAFDHFTHIRADLLGPIGPLSAPAPPADAVRLGAVVDWMVAGAPQMNASALAEVHGPVSLTLTGPAARTVQFLGEGEPAAAVTSSTADFVLCATRRRPWREMAVEVTGDHTAAAAFCDALHVM